MDKTNTVRDIQLDVPSLDGAVELLLVEIRQAMVGLDRAAASHDSPSLTRSLQQAADTYSSLKHLLPKLGLAADQVATVREHLASLKERLLDGH